MVLHPLFIKTSAMSPLKPAQIQPPLRVGASRVGWFPPQQLLPPSRLGKSAGVGVLSKRDLAKKRGFKPVIKLFFLKRKQW